MDERRQEMTNAERETMNPKMAVDRFAFSVFCSLYFFISSTQIPPA
jgi:hypothetical protein